MGNTKNSPPGAEISLGTIVRKLVREYDLPDTKQSRDNLRRAILRTCEKIPVATGKGNATLKEVVSRGNGEKRTRYIFTRAEQERLLESDELYEYIEKTNPDADISEHIRRQREADRRIMQYQSALAVQFDEHPDNDYYGVDFVSDAKVQQVKINMMIEAIFSRYFTPFDEQLLRQDLEMRYTLDSPFEETAESVAADERLMKPEGSYFEPRPGVGKMNK